MSSKNNIVVVDDDDDRHHRHNHQHTHDEAVEITADDDITHRESEVMMSHDDDIGLGDSDVTHSIIRMRRRSSSVFESMVTSKCGNECGYREATMVLSFASVFMFVVIMVLVVAFHDRPNDTPDDDCSGAVCSSHGVASTTHYLATQAAIDILGRGGNAVDAAVAAQFALNVVQPQSTGIGGGCFVMFYSAKLDSVLALDGREEAPKAFHGNSFCRDESCREYANCTCAEGPFPFGERDTGGHAAGVPGTLKAVERLLKDHGTMTLRDLISPAIRLARDGFPMYEHLFNRITQNRDRLLKFDASRELFLSGAGSQPLPVGATFRNPDLANTFELIAEHGSDIFYDGVIGEDVVNAARNSINVPGTNLTGLMTVDDLKVYRAVYRSALSTTYRENFTVYGMPYPSSGGATIDMVLKMLENFDLGGTRMSAAAYFRRFIDAQNVVWADRNKYMADADWIDVPSGLHDRAYASDRIDDKMRAARAAPIPVAPGTPPSTNSDFASSVDLDRHGTTHFVIWDRWNNVVSQTTTIEENLGCAVVVPGRGFLLNNELTDFSAQARDPDTHLLYANRPDGGRKPRRTAIGADALSMGSKRPMSSMSPTIILKNGAPYFALGSPGGSRIIGTVLNVLLNVIDGNATLVDATGAPRIVSRNDIALAEKLLYDSYPGVVKSLEAQGYQLQEYHTSRPSGYVQSALRQPNGLLAAMADSRMPSGKAMGL